MATYKVRYTANAEVAITVEADDEDAAINQAEALVLHIGICAHCADQGIVMMDWEPVLDETGVERVKG